MPVVHDKYKVPVDVAAKLATGEYTRYGSVVHDNTTGKIVMHLKSINRTNPQLTANLAKGATQLAAAGTTALAASSAPVVGGVVVAGGIAAVAGTAIYKSVKNKQASAKEAQIEQAAETKALEEKTGSVEEPKAKKASTITDWLESQKSAKKEQRTLVTR